MKPTDPPPARAWLPAGPRQLIERALGRRRSGPNPVTAALKTGKGDPDPLLLIGARLREAREAHGLQLHQLSRETLITTAVLEAIERGWRERLPEGAYLRTMLPLLERRLDLPAGSLAPILKLCGPSLGPPRRSTRGGRLQPGSIELFTSWQGTVVYGLAVLGLIHALNVKQWQLAASQRLTLVPVPARVGAAGGCGPASTDDSQRLLAAHPELRPLRQAEAGVALARLRSEQPPAAQDLSLGRLELRLEQPTRLVLTSSRGPEPVASRLEGVQGELDLPVLPPFELKLDPPPPAGQVRWRGQPLPPAAGAEAKPGAGAAGALYRYPPAAARPKPAAMRP